MKKVNVLLSIVLVLMFAMFALGSGEETSKNQGTGTAENQESDTSIGDYTVEIQSCRLAKDYEGKDVVIVKYFYTNVANDDATAFFTAFDETVYQNGVGLNESYFVDDSAKYNSDNQMKEIKKGASLEVEVAYELNDTTTDIEVEVKELFSFDDTIITKTFSIAQ
ncbi:MAG: DUF5067 domain-containing protein [Lachnospiraceae bacterium]|nr:DUF5067 domain-containing protein [Lachnospiraceae bacterium]